MLLASSLPLGHVANVTAVLISGSSRRLEPLAAAPSKSHGSGATTPPHIGDNTIAMEDISIGPLPEEADDATDPHIEDPAREGATARGNVVEERTLDTQNAIHLFPEAATDPHLEDPETSAREGATARDSVVEERTLDTSLNGETIWAQLMPDAARSETNTIWAQIPDEVLIRVLSFLPLRTLFQMRVVCKRWSSMIRSSDFNRMCVDVQAPAVAPHPAICYVYNRLSFRWAIYSGTDRQWQLMPDFFHGRSEQERMKKREVYVASRGLLCLLEVGDVDVIKSLTIWNPLTNHEQKLPAFLSSWSFPLVRIMFHDARTNAYKLILAGNQNYHPEDERYSATEIYDSAHGAWIRGGKLLPSLRFPFSNGAICNGAVYYFASRPMTMYDILVVYDVDENEWSEINHVIPSNTYCTPYLFECDGNLLTVMHVLSGPPARIASCAIFHLDFRTKEWGMLIQMPHPVYMDFAYIGGCVASGKQLCVTGNAPNRDLIVAVYCPRNDAWFWLPPCPIASSADLIERHTTFTFHPTFAD